MSYSINTFKHTTCQSAYAILLALTSLTANADKDSTQALLQTGTQVLVNQTEGLLNKKANQWLNNLGEGYSEFELYNLESNQPAYSIQTIQPLSTLSTDSDTLSFVQGRLSSAENQGNRRLTLNLGLGQRYLVDEGFAIAGVNVFTDYENKSKHSRASLGLEYQRSNFDVNFNHYFPLSDKRFVDGYEEEPLAGYDVNVSGQAPYLPWAKLKASQYYWDQIAGDNIKGSVLGAEVKLSSQNTLEFGVEDANDIDKRGYLRLTLRWPFDKNLIDHAFALDTQAFKDVQPMRLSELDMVKRSNQIRLEKSASNMVAGGITYSGVVIGTQTWTAQNMRHTAASGNTWSYDNDASNDANSYGKLYDWTAAMNGSTTEGAQGICGVGWHVPSDADWKTLESYLGMSSSDQNSTGNRGTDQGTKLKAGGSSGFEGMLAGVRSSLGSFVHRDTTGYLWSSTESSTTAFYRSLSSANATVYRSTNPKTGGMSVRCVKD